VALTGEEKRILCDIVRHAIRATIEGGSFKDLTIGEESFTDSLKERKGVFVTIYQEGQLRGCMGSTMGVMPLWQACRENACSAALKDTRFTTLRKDELSEVTFEITVIGPTRALGDLSELRPGTSGLILRKGFRQQAFLPGAITHRIKDGHRMLDHLRSMSDIDPEDDSPEVWEAFEAVVFSEIDLQGE
jgi:AmmeMemoRadiSam system protein A